MKRLLALGTLIVTGCATIAHGPNETIIVNSRPSGSAATITCDGVKVSGTTPAQLVIPRKSDHCVVDVMSAGRARTVPLKRGFSGRFWVNFAPGASVIWVGAAASLSGNNDPFERAIVAGGALMVGSFLVDWITGSMYDRDLHEVTIDLEH